MIYLSRKEDCCGCGACEQICAKKAIQLIPDNEGFWYPKVNEDLCVKCGLCIKACPVINQNNEREPLDVYAAINKDENIRKNSSSGGIFSIVAEIVLEQGGVVFGVKFNENWEVVFDYIESIDDIDCFRRSKYVQAWVGNAYNDVLRFLKQDRLVLFTGTPCQIAGLRTFLRRDYENLLLMDVICEGVPSPKVWKKYLEEETVRQGGKSSFLHHPISENDVLIRDISFRNKENGWKKFSFSLYLSKVTAEGEKNSVLPSYINRNSAYMQAMFNFLDLRPICYECPFKSCKSYSDITIADYWGIDVLHPDFFDNKGTSMVYINTDKGYKYLPLSSIYYINTKYEEAFRYNNIITSSKKHPNRDLFFAELDKSKSIIKLFNRLTYSRYVWYRLLIKDKLMKYMPMPIYSLIENLWRCVRKLY